MLKQQALHPLSSLPVLEEHFRGIKRVCEFLPFPSFMELGTLVACVTQVGQSLIFLPNARPQSSWAVTQLLSDVPSG